MPASSCTVTGLALIGEEMEAEPVRITVEDGIIVSLEPFSGRPERWICPAFFNAHTHLGDTVAMDIPARGGLAELVRPPDGLKHRILASTPRADLVAGMRASIDVMLATGTMGFADFREGGAVGVAALREAAAGLPCRPVIFGRDGGEREADGIGISSVRDVEHAEALVAEARRLGRLVALHAGERDPSDVDDALSFEPDLLVHCTHATDRQLRACADADIPIAVCPRSNWVLGVAASAAHPPLQRMLDLGCRLFLGTDNVMFVQPEIPQEMAFAATVYRLPPAEILRAAVSGSALLGRSSVLEEGNFANFLVINPNKSNICFSRDPRTTIVKRIHASAIEQKVLTLK